MTTDSFNESPQCTARTKKCRKCKYAYIKGDKTWKCPECGESRRCLSKAVGDYPVCRMHGAGGGRPPGSKYNIAGTVSKAFARIFQHNELWEMGEQQAAMGARFEELHLRLDDLKTQGVDIPKLIQHLDKLEDFILLSKPNINGANQQLRKAREAIEPATREQFIWEQLYQNIEQMRKNSDSTKKWLQSNDQMIQVGELIEVIVLLTKLAFIFIPDGADRRSYTRRVRAELLPSKKEIQSVILEAEFK